MKKTLLLYLVLISSTVESLSQQQCNNGTGSNIYTKPTGTSYNCHQYVKAALVGGFINLSTGIPIGSENQYSNLYTNQTIATDPNFIQVCSVNDARAVVPAYNGDIDSHSSLKMDNGIYASTPNGSSQNLYSHQNARTFTSACDGDERWFAAIPNVAITGTSAANQGMTFTLTLTNNGQPLPSYVQLES